MSRRLARIADRRGGRRRRLLRAGRLFERLARLVSRRPLPSRPPRWSGSPTWAAGVVAWHRRPSERIGLLFMLVGVAWYLPALTNLRSPFPFIVGNLLGNLYQSFLAYLALAWPSGYLRYRRQRVVVVLVYADELRGEPRLHPVLEPKDERLRRSARPIHSLSTGPRSFTTHRRGSRGRRARGHHRRGHAGRAELALGERLRPTGNELLALGRGAGGGLHRLPRRGQQLQSRSPERGRQRDRPARARPSPGRLPCRSGPSTTGPRGGRVGAWSTSSPGHRPDCCVTRWPPHSVIRPCSWLSECPVAATSTPPQESRAGRPGPRPGRRRLDPE